jgi:hypothetical protein
VKQHLILDTRMRRDEDLHWTECTCGAFIEAASNLELADSWNLHRSVNGERASRSVSLLRTGEGKIQPSVGRVRMEARR